MQALDGMAEQDREVLTHWFAGSGISERELAARLGLTRHRARLGLAGALARFAMRYGSQGLVSATEFDIVLSLFSRGCSVAEAARELGLTTEDVRVVRECFLHAVTHVMRGSRP